MTQSDLKSGSTILTETHQPAVEQATVVPKTVSSVIQERPKLTMVGGLPLISKETSWLSFNERVLQEAADPTVPLMERVRFLGIFSSNMDEFFRVRVASLKRLVRVGKRSRTSEGHNPRQVLKAVQKIAVAMYQTFDATYGELLKELAQHRINFVDEKGLDEKQEEFVKSYFHSHVRPRVTPIMIDQIKRLPAMRDDSTYLVACLRKKPNSTRAAYALIEVPSHVLPRFVILPPRRDQRYVMFLDDVIRVGLKYIFGVFHYSSFEAYAIKFSRDAELDFDDDIWSSYVKRVSRGLKLRKEGRPVRFLHDASLPRAPLQILTNKLRLGQDDPLISGGRYHNLRDLMKFPDLGLSTECYEPFPVLFHRDIDRRKRLTETIGKREVLVHYPYQSFQYVLDFLRDSSIDPHVTSIKFTIYRTARISSVATALINAARNGKKVTVVLELQARFDEENNILWANRLQEEGVKVLYGIPGLKFHAKLCLVTRTEDRRSVRYALIGTGNWHEETAKLYSDHCLFTSDRRLTREVDKIFQFCESPYRPPDFSHLIVSPFSMRKKLLRFINHEVANAKKGRPSGIFLKLNNLVDGEIIKALYGASKAGVPIKLIVRSMFSLVPGLPKYSENIEAVSIVDRFLEHSRIFVFTNDGKPLYYLSSADLMTRNLDRRLEVTCPIYDRNLQRELQDFLDIQWADNTKARVLDAQLSNQNRALHGAETVRAQWKIYESLKERALVT